MAADRRRLVPRARAVAAARVHSTGGAAPAAPASRGGLHLLVPLPRGIIVVGTAVAILALQFWGSYRLIRNVFRWLALTLLAYVGAAVLARPDLHAVLRGTLVPRLHFDREFLSLLVAV